MSEITINFAAPTAPVSFYAVRRYFGGVDTDIALVYAEQTSVSESTLVSQTAALENNASFGSSVTKSMPALTSSVYWSEAFPRVQLPVLLLTAQNAGATQGIVADTDLIISQDLTRISDGSSGDYKAALTNYGLVRVMSLAPPTLRLTVGWEDDPSGLNEAPPLQLAAGSWQTSNPCAIPLYAGAGPFTGTNYSITALPSGWEAPRPECVNIAFNGVVTMFVELLPWSSGYDHYAFRYTAPSPASSSDADPWVSLPGVPVIAANGTNQPYAVFRCNSGTTVMVTQDVEIEIGVLRLSSVNASFASPAATLAGDTILEIQYGIGIVFAYGDDQLLWFCNAYDSVNKNSFYRYINTSSGSYTNSQATGFTGDLLVYAGTNGPNLYVATSDGTIVNLYSFDGTSWSSATQIIATSGGIVDLLADIIVGDSALIVAVLSSSVVCYTHSLV
jgi:hypothetical protein